MTGDRRYVPREFLRDIRMLLSDVVSSRMDRFRIRRPRLRPTSDPHAAWKDEARLWIDRLVRQDSRSAA
jgi:hypothetical protein